MAYLQTSESNEVLKYPASVADLKKSFPNTSFPKNLEDLYLGEFGFFPVESQPFPNYDPAAQYVVESTPKFINNAWCQIWEVYSFTAEELAAAEAIKADSIRESRNALLAESDWTQFNDSPLSENDKTAWLEYRQALRDITDQSGFPSKVVWPELPV